MRDHRTRLSALGVVLLLLLAGCVGEPSERDDEVEQPEPTVGQNSPWVQDLWVYNQIQTVTADGEVVDLTEHILAGLTTPDSSEPMPDGATFHVYDSLAPTVTSAGILRSDLSVVAGVIETENVRALAALATPLPDAVASVGLDDAVELDLTFLGDLLAPGDPLVAELLFIQTRPDADEPVLGDIALLSERLANGRAFSLGTPTDAGMRMLPLTGVLGQAVAGSTRMSLPGKNEIPFPNPYGPMADLFCPKIVLGPKEALKCLEDYFDSMIDLANDANKFLKCNLGPCEDPPPGNEPDDLCIGLDCPTPSVRSDPHLLSFDGKYLSMQGVGEYVLTRGDGIEVQMRTTAVGAHRTASAVTMVAVQIGADRAVIGVDDDTARTGVWINDVLVDYDVANGYQQSQHGEFLVTQTAWQVLLEASDGSKFYLRRGLTNLLDLTIKLSDQATDLAGLLGDNDGDPGNDWRARDGSVVAADAKGRMLYTGFSDSWRVTQGESILRYGVGEDTQTFTDMSYPEQILTLADLEPAVRAQAEQLCRLAGVTNAVLLEQCTLDYALTGEIAFVLSAQQVEYDFAAYAAHVAARDLGGGEQGPEATESAWALTPASAGAPEAEVFVHVCPSGGIEHTVWGGTTGVYTADSSICTAAVHAGLLTIERGGTVEVVRLPGLDDYGPSSTQHGITAREWQRAWPESFRVDGEIR